MKASPSKRVCGGDTARARPSCATTPQPALSSRALVHTTPIVVWESGSDEPNGSSSRPTDSKSPRGARVYGVSTQRPEDQEAFATRQRLPFPLLSDQELRLAAGLRLPTCRTAGSDWLKRGTLLVGSDREIRGVLYPVPDPAGSVDDALALLDRQRTGRHAS